MVAGNPHLRQTEPVNAAIIDAGIGNIDSVLSALRYLGVEARLASTPEALSGVRHIVLPGVGAFRAGMAALEDHGLIEPLRVRACDGETRLLGICLGMQLLGEHSEEGDCEGLGIIPFRVQRISTIDTAGCNIKVPHVGFSTVYGYQARGFFADLDERSDFYFTHSYAVHDFEGNANVARTLYGEELIAAFEIGRICGAQFHPEKSQSNGLQLFKNFFEL